MPRKLLENEYRVSLFILVVIFSFPIFAFAQANIDRATIETDRLGREEQEKAEDTLRRIPPKPAEPRPKEIPIKKEAEQKFFIKKINLLGCESVSAQEFSFLISQHENKEVTLSELEALAKDIESEYLKRGIIAAVFLPQQESKDQVIILQVVEARMGELQIQNGKYFRNKRLSHYWHLREGEILRYDKISKSLQLMNENPDRDVKVALHAGKKVGTTDAILTQKTNFPLHLTATFDREGAVSTGRERQGYGVRHNNLLGLDDTLLTGYNFGRDFSGFFAYHSIPLTSQGMSLLYGYSKSQSKPSKEDAEFGVKSEAEDTTFSLSQDIYRKGEYLGEVSLGLDTKDKTVWLNSGVFSRDRLRIIRAGGNFLHRGKGSITYLTAKFSQGIDALGASSNSNPLASRGAKSQFSKFETGIQYKKALPLKLQTNLRLKAMVSSTKLTPQEEFYLGGIDTVRGYPYGDYLADNALFSSAELLMPSFFIPKSWHIPYAESSLRDEITALVFIDYGWGMRRSPVPTDKKDVNLLSAGPGVRVNLFNQALLRLEWGFPLGANRPITEGGGRGRFHFSVDFQEKFPEEIERIRKLAQEENIKQWAWQLVDAELASKTSPARSKLCQYLYLADMHFRQNEFKEAREAYINIVQLGRSLYRQAEDYVRGCLEKQLNLRKENKLALVYYKEGKLDKAKELWENIVQNAKPEPLIFEF